MDEMGPPGRVQLREHVIEQEERRPPVEPLEEVQLGELQGEDGGPLLTPRREGGEVAALEREGDIVAMRSDERRPVPELLLGRIRETPLEGLARALRPDGRGVREVLQAECAPAGLLRRDLGL